MGSYNSIPDVTATQSLSINQIDLNNYYRNDPTRRINVAPTQSWSVKQIDLNNYYRNDPTRRINVAPTQSLSVKQIDLNNYYRNDPTRRINVTATQSSSIKQIDLNNYYRNDPTRRIIHCQICKSDILRKDVFKHTVSKRHKYNKLFVAVSQNRCPNGDVDFIVLDIDRLACRYCDFRLMINSDSDDLIISHIQGVRHIQEKQVSLNETPLRHAPVSSAGYINKMLQPLDSFVTHDIKNRKRMKKKAPKIQKKASSLVNLEGMLEQLRVRDNVGQNTDQQYSSISGDYQKKWGKELPKCIIIREGDSYICTICCIEIPKDTNSLGIHINGIKHTRKMISESMQPEIIDADKLSAGFKIQETVTDFKATNNIVENNIPQSSAVYRDEGVQIQKEFEDCISLGENGTSRCTVCGTEIPNTPKNINEHLGGKKHMEKIVKLIESKKQKLKLEYVKKLISAPVSIVKPSRYKCTICNVWVKNHVKQIKAHEDGKKHVKMMLQPGKLIL